MSTVSLILGRTIFSVDTLVIESLQRTTGQRWSQQARIGRPDAHQFLGQEADDLTIPCAVYPCAGIGNMTALDALRRMANSGQSYLLIDQTGRVYGLWIIVAIDDERPIDGGIIHFTLNLRRYNR